MSQENLPGNSASLPPETNDLTGLLQAWNAGDGEVLESLVPRIYGQLKQLASRHLRGERADHTLQTTALVNEAFIRLAGQNASNWESRLHFFRIASTLMRRILVDHARKKLAEKRGGHVEVLPLDDALVFTEGKSAMLVALNEALDVLAERDARQAQIVELRYFGGLSVEETAAALDIAPVTVKRDWAMARAWLLSRTQPDMTP
jgi:RNA polymerase sigma-70 factor, ECF subfamily